jgi:hypothetical protein
MNSGPRASVSPCVLDETLHRSRDMIMPSAVLPLPVCKVGRPCMSHKTNFRGLNTEVTGIIASVLCRITIELSTGIYVLFRQMQQTSSH